VNSSVRCCRAASLELSVVISLCCPVFASLLQKLTHQRIASGYDRSNRPYYQHALWIVGLCLVMFASVADVIALCFAPQSLIAPLGALTMVSNVIFAPLLLHEKIGVRDLVATGIILGGSVTAVIFGAHTDLIYPIDDLFGLFRAPQFMAYAACVFVGVAGFFVILHRFAATEEAHRNGRQFASTERILVAR
jgi:drug/metabolite transporter (DMT)-like permease